MFNLISAQTFLTSSTCNLNCSYCTIAKLPILESIQKKKLKIFSVNNNIRTLSLWGGEPSLGFKEIIERWDEIEKCFPNLEEISTSTNQINPDLILELLDFISETRPDLKVSIQLSDDSIFNYENRGVYREFISECTRRIVTESPSELKLDFSWKPTIRKNNLSVLKKKLDAFIMHYSDIYKSIEFKENISFPPVLGITLEVPGDYSKKDGKCFRDIIKQINSFRDDTLIVTTGYHSRLSRLLDFSTNFAVKHSMFICSAGDSSIEVDRSGRLHFCHESYFLREPEYVQEISSVNTKGAKYIQKSTVHTFPVDEELNTYAYRAFQDFYEPRVSYCQFVLRELAEQGLVLRKYRSFDVSQLLSLFLATACHCPARSYLDSGSWHTTPDSLMLVFGNGAFDEIAKFVLNIKRQEV